MGMIASMRNAATGPHCWLGNHARTYPAPLSPARTSLLYLVRVRYGPVSTAARTRSTRPIGMLGVWPAHYVRRYLRRGITDLFPATGVLSLILPAERCDCVRGTFCEQSLFFRSEEAASRWMALHPEAVLHAARGSGVSRANGRPDVAARGSCITMKERNIPLAQRAARKNIPDRHSVFHPATS